MLQSIKTIKFKEYIVVPLAICRGQKVSLGAMPPFALLKSAYGGESHGCYIHH